MATITKTYTENKNYDDRTVSSAYASTWTVSVIGTDVKITSRIPYDSVNIPIPTLQAKYVHSNKNRGAVSLGFELYAGNTQVGDYGYEKGGLFDDCVSMASGTAYKIPLSYDVSGLASISALFNNSNPTTRSLNVVAKEFGGDIGSTKSGSYYQTYFGYRSIDVANLGTLLTITLDTPPTFGHSRDVTYSTAKKYAGITSATVSVSNPEAEHGGYISNIEFRIGNQIATRNDAGQLTISPLDTVGEFTPTITVTDSRGQTAKYEYPKVTVNGYAPPTVDYNVQRATDAGAVDDEGECALVTANFNWESEIATLAAPAVTAEDLNENEITTVTSWYSDSALTTPISNWSSVSAMPVYGLVKGYKLTEDTAVVSGKTYYRLTGTGTDQDPFVYTEVSNPTGDPHAQGWYEIAGVFDKNYSYKITITPNDSRDSGVGITQTLGAAFYTIDFLAGGHGIAFGTPALQDGFFCNMDAHFKDASGVIRNLLGLFYPVGSYYETSLPYTINSHSYDNNNLTDEEIAACGSTWFDPRVAWGGTWERETEGKVHVGAGSTYTAGSSYGSDTHTHTTGDFQLKEDHIPAHTHGSKTVSGKFRIRKVGSGTAMVTASTNFTVSDYSGTGTPAAAGSNSYKMSDVEFSQSHTHTSYGNSKVHNHGSTGSSTRNSWQPSIAVYRWHRTA